MFFYTTLIWVAIFKGLVTFNRMVTPHWMYTVMVQLPNRIRNPFLINLAKRRILIFNVTNKSVQCNNEPTRRTIKILSNLSKILPTNRCALSVRSGSFSWWQYFKAIAFMVFADNDILAMKGYIKTRKQIL